jgi:L-arabinose isomerase
MMMIMKKLTGKPVYWGEYTYYDVNENAFLFNHHGDGDPRLARSDRDIYLTLCAEKWGSDSFALEFSLKPGVYTLGSFIDDDRGFKFLVARGECLDIPPFRIQTPHALIRTEQPVIAFFETVMRHGFRHHAALCPGDCVEELCMIADAVGARKVVLR